MTSIKSSWIIALIMLTTTASLWAQSTETKRSITLELNLPNGATPQLRVAEGEAGSVEIPKLGKFGFVPTLKGGNSTVVLVELFDLNRMPHQRLGRVEAIAGGDAVRSDTKPQFGVRVVRIVEQ
jgi:hypothetical protein